MGWFKRIKEGITTETHEKKETPDGLWYKCPKCKHIVTSEDHKKNLYCCINCNHHDRIGSNEYFSILFDKNKFTELDSNMTSLDPLNFKDKSLSFIFLILVIIGGSFFSTSSGLTFISTTPSR